METTAAAAARIGVSPDALRRMAARGLVPGALRLSGTTGPWRFPAAWTPGDTIGPVPVGDRAGVTAQPLRGDAPHVTSSQAALSPVARARTLAGHLATVTARPAVALTDALYLVADNATRHQPGRDGWCMACGWQYPCADRRAADAVLDRVTAVVMDGAR